MKDGIPPGPGTRSIQQVARAAVGVAAVATLALAAGCGESALDNLDQPQATTGVSPGLPSGLPTNLPTGLPTGIPTSLSSDLSVPGANAAVPENFPIPPGAKKEVTEVGSGQTLRLTGVSAEDSFAYYRNALPGAGYTIASDNAGSIGGVIRFTGKDVEGLISGTDILGQSAVLITFSMPN